MKVRAYIKIAKNGYKTKVSASAKSDNDPLFVSGGYSGTKLWLPTVGFAVDFNVPDELFDKAQKVIAEIDVGLKGAKVLAELPVPEKSNEKRKK